MKKTKLHIKEQEPQLESHFIHRDTHFFLSHRRITITFFPWAKRLH